MRTSLLIAALLAFQDPPPAPKTVEDRLKQLETRLAALEKKQKTLADENASMETRVAEKKAAVELLAQGAAKAWVGRHAEPLGFTEQQSAEFEALWYGWSKDSAGFSGTPEEWKKREEILRDKLTKEQRPLLARRVREGQEQNARLTLTHIVRTFQLPAERTAEWEKTVLAKVVYDDDMLIPQAHATKGSSFAVVLAAAEESLPALSLSTDEQSAARQALEQFKPRKR